ncbi:MAG: hypothetical protein ACTSRK_18285 [Promethearchaeota archaeon]
MINPSADNVNKISKKNKHKPFYSQYIPEHEMRRIKPGKPVLFGAVHNLNPAGLTMNAITPENAIKPSTGQGQIIRGPIGVDSAKRAVWKSHLTILSGGHNIN